MSNFKNTSIMGIIDYGVGNLGSLVNILKRIGVAALVSRSAEELAGASHLILPGVGRFDHGITKLRQLGLHETLEKLVFNEKKPILGICLGMQLLCNHSEEGNQPGLGWIDADVTKFIPPADNPGLRIPHMGWNSVDYRPDHALFRDPFLEERFYFTHSYKVKCKRPSDVVAITSYGAEFVSVFNSGNIFGVQFHPEKSLKNGMKLLGNFARFKGS
jgi:glutamine amidotransferase